MDHFLVKESDGSQRHVIGRSSNAAENPGVGPTKHRLGSRVDRPCGTAPQSPTIALLPSSRVGQAT